MTTRAVRDFPPLPPVHPTWRYFAVGKRHPFRHPSTWADVAAVLGGWLAKIESTDRVPASTPMRVTVIEGSLVRLDWTREDP